MGPLVYTPTDPQQELLKQYCAEAEAMLKTSTSEADARKVGMIMCSRFEQECSSALVIQATRAYIGDVIRRMFGEGYDAHRANDRH